jgi:transcriptional regulator with XRE-family HTH domain
MNKLTELRKQYKLTQKELAEILDVKQQQVSRWEVVGINPLTYNGIEYILDQQFCD